MNIQGRMMPFRSNVPREKPKSRIFNWWLVLIFLGLLLGLFLLLYPEKRWIASLTESKTPSPLALTYLQNMVALQPNNADLKIALAQQELGAGHLNDAQAIITAYLTPIPYSAAQWKALWIYYQIIRIKAYALQPNNPQRQNYTAIIKSFIPLLVQSNYLTNADRDLLAQDALSFNQVKMGISLYKINTRLNSNRPASYFIHAAKVSLFVSDYQTSADFYLLAMQKSKHLTQKRDNFIAALKSLMSGDLYSQAIDFIQENIDGLSGDDTTILFITNMALAAGKPAVAEKYIKQIIHLTY